MRSIHGLLFFLAALLLFTGCRKKEWDEYYGRPDGLADPIYKELEKRGNFKIYLSALEKSGYKDIIGKAGLWTVFAPNDEAFQKFFQENGISSLDDTIKFKNLATKIATYSIVYNSFRKDNISDYQQASGALPGLAFKRKTAYYDFVYDDYDAVKKEWVKAIANNRNGLNSYSSNDNNNKYIPYFTDRYLGASDFKASDYEAFYPGSKYTGFNVASASVINADIPAENGIIHEVDKVTLPLPNIEQYIKSKPEYFVFDSLLTEMQFLSPAQLVYSQNQDITSRYTILNPANTKTVYTKSYSGDIGFSPNNEGFENKFPTDAQGNSWTITVPTNDALRNYINNDVLMYYKTFKAAPASVLIDLIKSQTYNTRTAWPSMLATEANTANETANFSLGSIVDRKILSNGVFYGMNAVQKPDVFRTVYGKSYLNPRFSLMTRLLNNVDVKLRATSPAAKLTLLLMDDDVISNPDPAKRHFLGSLDNKTSTAYYNFNGNTGKWQYFPTGASVDASATAEERINRIAQTALLNTPNGEFENLNSAGYAIARGFNGEYVRYDNGRFRASGNVINGTSVGIKLVNGQKFQRTDNGTVYELDSVLTFAENSVTVGMYIEKLGNVPSSSPRYEKFNYYYKLLTNSSLWSSTDKTIQGVAAGTFHTIFAPTNEAIRVAVEAGLIPAASTGSREPNFTPSAAKDKAKIEAFLKYSIVTKVTVAANGIDNINENLPTLLRNYKGDARTVKVQYLNGNLPQNMTIVSDNPNPANPTPGTSAFTTTTIDLSNSNNLANRALIHSVDRVLNYIKCDPNNTSNVADPSCIQ